MRWLRRSKQGQLQGDERASFLAAEGAQRWVCEHWGAPFDPLPPDRLVTISPLVLQGHMPVAGVRYEMSGSMSGWIIYASDRNEQVDELQVEHAGHLATARPDLLPYLALPVGWRFDREADGENVRLDAGQAHDGSGTDREAG